jgi:hypothetical protein
VRGEFGQGEFGRGEVGQGEVDRGEEGRLSWLGASNREDGGRNDKSDIVTLR